MNAPAAERFDDNNFTMLRLFLALMVVFGHYRIFYGDLSYHWPFGYAATAVECFFVVSGYLVTHSLDRDPNILRFYIRRLFRIYPLYLTIVALQTLTLAILAPPDALEHGPSLLRYFAVNAVFANFLQYDVGTGVLQSLYEPNLNPSLWTLKLEIGFYLILPAVWWAVRRFGAGVLIGIFLLSAAYFAILDHADNYRLAKQLPGQLSFFVLGIAAYLYRQRLPALSPAVGLALTLALGVGVTMLSRVGQPILYPLCVGGFVIAAALYAPRLRLRADASYGVYLIHAPLIQLSLLLGLYRPDWEGLGSLVAATTVLALIAEVLIEKPGIALGKRLARSTQPRPIVPAHVPGTSLKGLHVVILNDFCYVQGGASKVAIDEAVGLAHAGINVIFMGAVGPPSAVLRNAPLRVECLGQHELLDAGRHPGVILQALWNFKAGRRLRALLRGLPPDRTVVHLHGYTKALSSCPVRVARRAGFRVVCTLHDFFIACPNGAFFDYRAGIPCTKRGLSSACMTTMCDKRHPGHKAFRFCRGLLQRWAGRLPATVDTYISLSRRSAKILNPYLPKAAHVHFLENMTDTPAVARAVPAAKRTLLCVGRLDQEKGVRLLAEVAARLDLPVTFVGEGPLRAEIERFPGMTVTGWLTGAEVARHLSEARCLVFPSLWYETYGLVVAEAAALGIPAIVSDISAAAERVIDGVSGWHFRSGDPDDLARCLRLAADDDAIAAAGAAAHQGFWEMPETRDVHAGNLMRIYRAALAA